MTEKAAELIVEVQGKSTNLSDILRQTQTELKQAAAGASAAGEQIGGALPAGAKKAEVSIASLASAKARLAATTGQLSEAERYLQAAIAAEDGETLTSIRLKTQLAGVQKQLTNSTGGLSGKMSELKGALGSVTGLLAAGGFAVGTQQLIQMGGELITLGNQATRVKSSFDELAKAGGTSGNAMLTQLRAAAHGEISDLNLELAANRAQLLGVAKSAGEMGQLLEIARDRAKKMGTDTSSALSDIVTGLGRASPMILDNLGFTIKLGAAHEEYARKLGISAAALTDEQKKEALKNAIIKQGLADMAKTTSGVEDQAASVAKLGASWDNIKAKIGSALGAAVAPAANTASDLLNVRTQVEALGPQVLNSAQTWEQYQQKVAFANDQLGSIGQKIEIVTGGNIRANVANAALGASMSSLTEAQFNYARGLIQSGTAADVAITKAQALAPALAQIKAVQDATIVSTEAESQSMTRLANSMLAAAESGAEGAALVAGLSEQYQMGSITAGQMQAALDGLAEAHRQSAAAAAQDALEEQQHAQHSAAATAGSNDLAKSLAAQAVAALDATAKSAALNATQAAIANICSAAAGGLITDAHAAEVLAGSYGIATGEAYKLIDAQRQLANAKSAAIIAQAKALPSGGNERDEFQRERHFDRQREAADRAATNAHIAQRQKQLDYDAASNAEKLKLIRQDLAHVKAGSDAYFDLKEKELSLEKSLDKKAGKGAGGAGVKLSDQQKLNNTLLADQSKADDKSEQLAEDHARNLLKIEQDYAEKSLAQQKANEISKRQSQADFYDRLTSSDLNKSKNKGDKEALAQIDAQYQEAYAKAQQIAQAGNAKLAADYLAFKQKQAEAELSYAESVAKAKADKDKAEVNRLEQIHKLRQAAAAEEEKQLLEGGDANTNARDAALAAENEKYAEAQDKNADSADRAANRKIEAYTREGKKIDENTLKLQKQGKVIDSVAGTTSGVAPDAPTNTPATTTAGGTTPAALTPDPNSQAAQVAAVIDQSLIDAVNSASAAQLSALNAIVSGLAAVQKATTDVGAKVDKVASAVRSIPRGVA